MTFDNPFQCEGEWLKGNLHTHTTRSDGRLSPQERVAAYEARGYDFLALTDHDALADLEPLSPGRLVLIRGIEAGGENPIAGQPFHLVGLDLPAGFQLPRSRHAQSVIDAFTDAGGQAIVAHPYWCGQSIRDLEVVAGFLGVEVFNTTCHRGIGKGTSAVQWDDLLTRGRCIVGLAVDDAHGATRDAFQGWVMARCAARSVEAVMAALARGRFYSTCGPIIESVSVEGARIAVRTSPVAHISFICDGPRGGHAFHEDGSPVTAAEFTVGDSARFLRVECTDQAGRTAWTNPIVFR